MFDIEDLIFISSDNKIETDVFRQHMLHLRNFFHKQNQIIASMILSRSDFQDLKASLKKE